MKVLTAPPVVDYASHPGFADLVECQPGAEHEERFCELGAFVGRELQPRSSSFSQPEEAAAAVHRAIREAMDELGRAVDDESFSRFCASVVEMLAKSTSTFAANEWRRAPERSDDVDPGILSDLRTLGFWTAALDHRTLEDFRNATEAERQQLLVLAAESPTKRHQVHIASQRARDILGHVLFEQRVLQTAGAFKGTEYERKYLALEYSHPGQTWWQWNRYPDVGPPPPTSWFHYDKDVSLMKGLVYLEETSEENGPFSIVRGSHRQQWPVLAVVSSRIMDRAGAGRDWDRAHVHLLDDLEGKRNFMRLPTAMRYLTVFGDDLMPNTEPSLQLLKAEAVITSDLGNLLLFDSGLSIHRGGRCLGGSRWAIQFGIRGRDDIHLRL